MEIKEYVIQKEIELDERFIGNKELNALAKEGDKYAKRLPSRDMGKDAMGLPQSDRQVISSFYANYVNNVDHLKSLKPKIAPVRDEDTAGRKALKAGLTALNIKLKKNFDELPKIEARLKSAEKKSEVEKNVVREKVRVKKTQKGTLSDMKKQDIAAGKEKQESKIKAEKTRVKAAEKKSEEKAESKKKREEDSAARKEKRAKWIASVKEKAKKKLKGGE